MIRRAMWELTRLRDYEGWWFLWRPAVGLLLAISLLAAAIASVVGGGLLAADTDHVLSLAAGVLIIVLLPAWVRLAWRRRVWWMSVSHGLERWERIGRGTRFLNFKVANDDFGAAAQALRRAGFYAPGGRLLPQPEPGAECELDAYWIRAGHLEQEEALERAHSALSRAGIAARHSGGGTSLGPGSVWPPSG